MNAAPAPDRSAARELPFLSHQPLRRLAREQSGELTVAFALTFAALSLASGSTEDSQAARMASIAAEIDRLDI